MIMSHNFNDMSTENAVRMGRPSLAQLKTVVDFVEQNPELNKVKMSSETNNKTFKSLWADLANKANSIEGTQKTTHGWIKYWNDKKRSVTLKNRKITQGKIHDTLTPLEKRILRLSLCKKIGSKTGEMKEEPSNGDLHFPMEDDDEGLNEELPYGHLDKMLPTETDERSFNILDAMIESMGKQAIALSQMAQASLSQSKAMQQIAEASHKQALSVDRIATTFESMNDSVYGVRNAIMGIGYTIKGCYSANMQNRQHSQHVFI